MNERGTGRKPRAPGSSPSSPLTVRRDELDFSELRKHCKAMHPEPKYPRANVDLAAWHARQHHRYHLGHIHRGLWAIIRRPDGTVPAAQVARPMGWYTGRDAVTREQAGAEFRAKIAAREAEQTP